jgi:hypothetical protein
MIGCIRGCKKIAKYRGCCAKCYEQSRLQVFMGLMTWDQLEKKGLVLPRVIPKNFNKGVFA